MADHDPHHSMRSLRTDQGALELYVNDALFPYYTVNGIEKVEDGPWGSKYVTVRLVIYGPVEGGPEDAYGPVEGVSEDDSEAAQDASLVGRPI